VEQMSKFKAGDFVKGTNRDRFAPSYTDQKLIKAEVLRTFGDSMVIKVLNHELGRIIGNVYSVSQSYFDHYEITDFVDEIQISKDINVDVNNEKTVINITDSLFIALPKHAVFALASKHDDDVFVKDIGKSLAYYRYQQSL
jgi:hypothetical protein